MVIVKTVDGYEKAKDTGYKKQVTRDKRLILTRPSERQGRAGSHSTRRKKGKGRKAKTKAENKG